MRYINDKGLAVLKGEELLRLKAYKPLPTDRWTIGFGHAGSDVYEGMVITREDADELLERDLQWAEECVDEALPEPLISDDIFAALVLFTFNVGCQAFKTSHLLQYMQAGDPGKALDEFIKWHHSGGHDVAGLFKRRAAEANLFVIPDEDNA